MIHSLLPLPEPTTKIQNVPRVLVIGGEPSWVCRLGDLAVQDFLEGIHPLAVFVQSVLLLWSVVLLSFLLIIFFAQSVLCSSQSITYHKMHPANQTISYRSLIVNAKSNLLEGCIWKTLKRGCLFWSVPGALFVEIFFCGQFGRLRCKDVMWPDIPDKASARPVSRALPEVLFFHFQILIADFSSLTLTSSTARSWNEAWILMMEHCAWILRWFWCEFCTNCTVNCISASIVIVPLSGKHILLWTPPPKNHTHTLSPMMMTY